MPRLIESTNVVETPIDMSALEEVVRHFLDPKDIRKELTLIFAENKHAEFFRGWLIMGIDDQYGVKCFIPIEETVQYTALTFGGRTKVHGSNIAVYDAICKMPIDQRVPINTRYSLTIPMVEWSESEEAMARTIFADSIVHVDKTEYPYPFNRRNFLLCVLPGESLSMQLKVGIDQTFSIRERTHWYLSQPRGIVIGTQLNRDPIDYLKTIVRQLVERIGMIANSRFDEMLVLAGIYDKKEEIRAYFDAMHAEILAL